MSDLVKRLRIKAGMIQMGERIAWGSDTDLMYEAADMIERMLASEEQYTPADMADQGAKQFRAGQAGMYTAEDMCSQAAQGYRDGYAAAKGEGCQPADVAPAVQGEPASRVVPSRDDLIQCLLATHGQSEGITADAILSMLTAAPQPAEQQPDVAQLVEALELMVDTYDNGGWPSASVEIAKRTITAYRKGGEA